MLGAPGVGRKSLANQIRNPLLNRLRAQLRVDDFTSILDLSILDQNDSKMDQAYQMSDGFMLVFSPDSPTSIETMTNTYEAIYQVKDAQSPMVVVANKCDLELEDRQVIETGMEMAKHWNVPFFEVSAKTGLNVVEPYAHLIRQIRAMQPKKQQKSCCLQ